jgi:protoporphyrinogen oxidase
LKEKSLHFSNGVTDKYDILINTSPLDEFIAITEDAPDVVRKASKDLASNSVYVVGIGLKKKLNNTKCWMYFPKNDSPFYRVTHFSNYSPNNIPGGDSENYCSYMCETAFSKFKPVDKESIIAQTIQGLINSKMVTEEDRKLIVSTYLIEAKKGYPVPTLKRDRALLMIQPFLQKHNIFSRGRFGAWKYEVGNMDHSVMQGVEVINRILYNKKEKTIYGEMKD